MKMMQRVEQDQKGYWDDMILGDEAEGRGTWWGWG